MLWIICLPLGLPCCICMRPLAPMLPNTVTNDIITILAVLLRLSAKNRKNTRYLLKINLFFLRSLAADLFNCIIFFKSLSLCVISEIISNIIFKLWFYLKINNFHTYIIQYVLNLPWIINKNEALRKPVPMSLSNILANSFYYWLLV